MLWVLLVVVIIIWVLQQRWLSRRQRALARQLKSNIRAYPIIGHGYKFIGILNDIMKSFQELGRDAIAIGGVSKLLLGQHLLINVADPVVAEVVMTQCLEKHDNYKVMNRILGDSSLIAPVHDWRPRRKINMLVFNTKNLVRFCDAFVEQGAVLADRLEKKAGRGTFSIWEYVAVYGVNTICENTMGVKIDDEENKFSSFIEEILNIGAYIILQPWTHNILPLLPIYNKGLQLRDNIKSFIEMIIQGKQKLLKDKANQSEDHKGKVVSFLDLQLEESEKSRKYTRIFTKKELYEEALLLVMAGYDTSVTVISLTVLMISRHPDIQDKVYKELLDIFGNSDRPADFEDLSQLNYLEAVIKETMRLYPIVSVIGRQADKDVTLPSGLTIVKGCGICVNIWAIHRNPEYWGEDAEQFRPERFLDYSPKHPAAYMPFSYGPRKCIGYRYAMLSVKTVLSTLLRRYRVVAPPGVAQGEPLKTRYDIITKHVDNYEIQLEHRTKQ